MRLLRGKHLLELILIIQLIEPLGAQTLPLHTYTSKDGLPSNLITALFQDSRGFLWIGTNNGLSVYNGSEFRNYSTANGLTNNWITSIVESRTGSGNMWIGTIAGGLNRLVDGHWTRFDIDTLQGTAGYIGSLLEDNEGNLWCSSRVGTYVVNASGLTPLRMNSSHQPSVEITSTEDGLVWIATSRNLYAFTHPTAPGREIGLPMGDKSSITALSPGLDGAVWVGTSDSSLHLIRGSRIVSHTKIRFGIPSKIIRKRGLLWVRTYDYIITVREDDPDQQSPLLYKNEEGLPRVVPPLLIDREDILWIGSWVNGLQKLADRSFIHIPFDRGDASGLNSMASVDSHGHVWVGSVGGLREFYRDDGGNWRSLFHPLRSGAINNPLLIDAFHRIWIVSADNKQISCYGIAGQTGGTSRLSNLHTLHQGEHYSSGSVVGISMDRRGRLWIATAPSGIVVFDLPSNKVLSRYPPTESKPFGHVTAMHHDLEDRMWIGTFDRGIYIVDTQHGRLIRHFSKTDGLPGDEIRSIFGANDGQMWIGTRHNGLAMMVGHGFKTLSMNDGLASNAIWAISEDSHNRLWLQTDVGVVAIDRGNLRPLPARPELVGQGVNSFGIHRNEFLWCKTPGGMTILRFSDESYHETPPLVHIQRFEANGEPVSLKGAIELAYHQNTLSLEYVGISLRNEKGVRYRYRMLGIDTNWSQPNNQRRVTYATLASGFYTFEVLAISGDGIASAQPASVSFTIIPPFWQRWWFLLQVAGAVSVLLWILHRYRVKKIVEMEHLRVRIASDLHDDVGTNLSSIQVASQIMERQATLSEQDRTQLKEIGVIAAMTQEMMRDIVWMLNPKNDTLDDFLLKMKEVAARLLGDIRYTFVVPNERLLDKVSIEFKRNIFLIFKESLNNIIQHSGATEAWIRVQQERGMFLLEIKDNGKGFIIDSERTGNGLANIRRRSTLMGGTVHIISKQGQGTTITLSVKNHANA